MAQQLQNDKEGYPGGLEYSFGSLCEWGELAGTKSPAAMYADPYGVLAGADAAPIEELAQRLNTFWLDLSGCPGDPPGSNCGQQEAVARVGGQTGKAGSTTSGKGSRCREPSNRAGVAANGPEGSGSKNEFLDDGALYPMLSPTDDRNTCPRCRGRMFVQELEYICSSCGFVAENGLADGEDDGEKKPSFCGRLRIVGPNSGRYQADLDRSSNSGNNTAAQISQVTAEYLRYRECFIEIGGRAFPEEACRRAAECYNEVQQRCVIRNHNKLTVMAAHLYHACVSLGFVPTKAEVATFMQLKRKGIARGDNFVKKMYAEGLTTVEVNKSPEHAQISTALLNLGEEVEKTYVHLIPVVQDLVQCAVDNLIGVSSTPRSKAIGATFVVMQRFARAKGIKCVSQQEFCQRCGIRKNTIEQFTSALAAYHSFFRDIYVRHGLFDGEVCESPKGKACEGSKSLGVAKSPLSAAKNIQTTKSGTQKPSSTRLALPLGASVAASGSSDPLKKGQPTAAPVANKGDASVSVATLGLSAKAAKPGITKVLEGSHTPGSLKNVRAALKTA